MTPRVQYARTYWVVPTDATANERAEIYRLASIAQVTCGPSYDDAGIGELDDKTAVLWGIAPAQRATFLEWFARHYPGTRVHFRTLAVDEPDPPEPPPPTGKRVLLGLHASADPQLAPGELGEFYELQPEVIKVLSHMNPEHVRQLAAQHPGIKWIVRAFLDFGGRDISPGQFVTDTLGTVRRTVSIIQAHGVPAGDIAIELHNEPNLTAEGLGASWASGSEFGAWFLAVLAHYRAALPGIAMLYPGLSPGAEIWQRGELVRYEAQKFLRECVQAVKAADGLAVHVYWSDPFPRVGSGVEFYAYLLPGVPIWVTEASRNDRPATQPPATIAREYVEFAHALGRHEQVRGVTYFVASAIHGGFADEVWVGRRLGRLVRALL